MNIAYSRVVSKRLRSIFTTLLKCIFWPIFTMRIKTRIKTGYEYRCEDGCEDRICLGLKADGMLTVDAKNAGKTRKSFVFRLGLKSASSVNVDHQEVIA